MHSLRYFCTSWSTEINLNIHVPFVLIWSIWRLWTADLKNNLLYEAILLFSLPWTTLKKWGIFKNKMNKYSEAWVFSLTERFFLKEIWINLFNFKINIPKDSLRLIKREVFILEWYIFPDRDNYIRSSKLLISPLSPFYYSFHF